MNVDDLYCICEISFLSVISALCILDSLCANQDLSESSLCDLNLFLFIIVYACVIIPCFILIHTQAIGLTGPTYLNRTKPYPLLEIGVTTAAWPLPWLETKKQKVDIWQVVEEGKRGLALLNRLKSGQNRTNFINI